MHWYKEFSIVFFVGVFMDWCLIRPIPQPYFKHDSVLPCYMTKFISICESQVPFHSEAWPDCLAYCSETALAIVKVDKIQVFVLVCHVGLSCEQILEWWCFIERFIFVF